MLDTLARHPHARAVLGGAVPPAGVPSHAYLFHGPAGAGKRAAASAFAAELLAQGAADVEGARRRVVDGVHPDLTWIRPSGAAGMVVEDVEEKVIGAATRTPFEARRRVFVLEQVDTMNDTVANRMLKTLEEPASFVHLLLLTDRRANVLPTIVSRCQLVRFEASSPHDIAAGLVGVGDEAARACALLSGGDAQRARDLAFGDGVALRAAACGYARACLAEEFAAEPWAALLAQARARGLSAAEEVAARVAEQAEALPRRERGRVEREGEVERKRVDRRERARTLDLGLELAALWLRDVAALADGAGEVMRWADRAGEVAADAALGCAPSRLREGVALVDEARTMLVLNPTEDLMLEALAYRVAAVLATR